MSRTIISRADASAAGLKRFFTGELCPRCGQVAEQYVLSGECAECVRRRNKKYSRSDRGKQNKALHNTKLAERRAAKRALGEVHYVGKPCPKHGEVKRYVLNDGCVECSKTPEVIAKHVARSRVLGGNVWISIRLSNTRRRAMAQGVPFDREAVREILVGLPDRCPVFGTKFVINKDKIGPDSPTVDRIVPTRGYVKGNVVVISARANAIKNDASAAELRALADWLDRLSR